MKRIIAILLLLISMGCYAEKQYTVGVFPEQPFSAIKTNSYSGLTVAIWREIAEEAGIKYKFVPLSGTTGDAINMVAAHKLDVVIGPISVMSTRVKRVKFSRPYFVSQLGILTNDPVSSFWHVLGQVLKGFVSYAVLIYIIFLLLYTLIYWFIERRCDNQDYQGSHIKSFGLALFRTTTFFLTQDVDQEVKSTFARCLGIIWVLGSIVFLSLVVASVTSSMTIVHSDLEASNNSQELLAQSMYGLKLAVRKDSYAAHITNMLGSNTTKVDSYTDGLKLLRTQQVSGLVGNYLSLLYYVHQYPKLKFAPQQLNVGSNEFAFAFPVDSPLLDAVNHALTLLQEQNTIFGICEHYLGAENATRCVI